MNETCFIIRYKKIVLVDLSAKLNLAAEFDEKEISMTFLLLF